MNVESIVDFESIHLALANSMIIKLFMTPFFLKQILANVNRFISQKHYGIWVVCVCN